jgi:hypothetical protein
MVNVSKTTWDEGTVRLRHIDKEGRTHYTEHRCWNAGRFVAETTASALIMGGNCVAVSAAEWAQRCGRPRG